jgi:ABC-type antimicrobial peptide transport system permease subunit
VTGSESRIDSTAELSDRANTPPEAAPGTDLVAETKQQGYSKLTKELVTQTVYGKLTTENEKHSGYSQTTTVSENDLTHSNVESERALPMEVKKALSPSAELKTDNAVSIDSNPPVSRFTSDTVNQTSSSTFQASSPHTYGGNAVMASPLAAYTPGQDCSPNSVGSFSRNPDDVLNLAPMQTQGINNQNLTQEKVSSSFSNIAPQNGISTQASCASYCSYNQYYPHQANNLQGGSPCQASPNAFNQQNQNYQRQNGSPSEYNGFNANTSYRNYQNSQYCRQNFQAMDTQSNQQNSMQHTENLTHCRQGVDGYIAQSQQSQSMNGYTTNLPQKSQECCDDCRPFANQFDNFPSSNNDFIELTRMPITHSNRQGQGHYDQLCHQGAEMNNQPGNHDNYYNFNNEMNQEFSNQFNNYNGYSQQSFYAQT